jgi:hypothetical protein
MKERNHDIRGFSRGKNVKTGATGFKLKTAALIPYNYMVGKAGVEARSEKEKGIVLGER